jgi:SSS family solute:Na+ symporter
VYGLTWLSGLGGFPEPEMMAIIRGRLPFLDNMPALQIAAAVVLFGLLYLPGGLVSGLGEEIGWRGFFVPELVRVTSFNRAALISGGVFAVGGILINNVIWPKMLPTWKNLNPGIEWLNALPEKFWLNGAQLAFTAALLCLTVYIVVSLLTCRKPFDLDKMLNRHSEPAGNHLKPLPRTGLAFFKMGPEFTRGDKIIYIMTIAWTLFFFGASLTIILVNQIKPLSSDFWSIWWFVNLILGITAAGTTFFWFMIGGIRDLRDLLKMLRAEQIDKTDDGQVQ